MADIGDEQSIAQSLSTFSSHLRNVVRFVAAAGPGTLVLLDEIGAGTDPTEGSALAMAIVTRLLDAGAMVAATTHYAELKTFATEHPSVTNAAVEFDVATLRPTYRLSIGLPGKSQAFAIAERLGLPAEILADARERISKEHVSMEETLAAISRAQDAQRAALDAAQAERSSAADERDRARAGVARARQEAGALWRMRGGRPTTCWPAPSARWTRCAASSPASGTWGGVVRRAEPRRSRTSPARRAACEARRPRPPAFPCRRRLSRRTGSRRVPSHASASGRALERWAAPDASWRSVAGRAG